MAIRPEDASLAEELATRGGVTATREFPDLAPVEQWARVIAGLRDAGYTIRKANDASDGPDFGMLYRRAEPKIRKAMAEIAPPGSVVNKELIDRLQERVVAILSAEMKAAGIPPVLADTLAGLMNAAMHIKQKKPA